MSSYGNLEPRIAVNFGLANSSSLKLSYNRLAQYIHLLSNTSASSPLDVWTPSSNNIKPQISDQIALGYFHNFSNNIYESSVEVYYKNFRIRLIMLEMPICCLIRQWKATCFLEMGGLMVQNFS